MSVRSNRPNVGGNCCNTTTFCRLLKMGATQRSWKWKQPSDGPRMTASGMYSSPTTRYTAAFTLRCRFKRPPILHSATPSPPGCNLYQDPPPGRYIYNTRANAFPSEPVVRGCKLLRVKKPTSMTPNIGGRPHRAYESRHSCRHPLRNSMLGSFALSALAAGPRAYPGMEITIRARSRRC